MFINVHCSLLQQTVVLNSIFHNCCKRSCKMSDYRPYRLTATVTATVSPQIELEKLNLSLQVSLQLGSKLKPQKFLYLPGTTVVPVENSRLCKDTGHGPSPSSRLTVIFVAFQLLAKHRCILSSVSSCVLWPPNLTEISF